MHRMAIGRFFFSGNVTDEEVVRGAAPKPKCVPVEHISGPTNCNWHSSTAPAVALRLQTNRYPAAPQFRSVSTRFFRLLIGTLANVNESGSRSIWLEWAQSGIGALLVSIIAKTPPRAPSLPAEHWAQPKSDRRPLPVCRFVRSSTGPTEPTVSQLHVLVFVLTCESRVRQLQL